MGLFKQINKEVKKEVKHEIKDAEDWMIARRKFFIRLGIVVLSLTALIIFSHLYLE